MTIEGLVDQEKCNHRWVRYDGRQDSFEVDGAFMEQYTCAHPVAPHCGATMYGRTRVLKNRISVGRYEGKPYFMLKPVEESHDVCK